MPARPGAARWIALAATLATFALSIAGGRASSIRADAGFQFVEDAPWFAGLHYRMGVDGISVLFVLLTAFLMPLCILASWTLDREPGARIHDRLPGARDPGDRRVLRARPDPVLPVLRGSA